MTMIHKTVRFSAMLLVMLAVFPHRSAAQSRELVLVRDGVAQAPVIVAPDATLRTRQAANELLTYIEKISGARPELVEGEPETTPDRAIWVGHQPKLNELFPDLDFDFPHPEEILIAANANHLVIAGRDRWHEDHLTVEGRSGTIEGWQQEYGTANAVYHFIQDYLDVRWFWPGEVGEDIIERDTIAFEPFEYRYHPQFRQRSTIFRLSRLGDDRGQSHAWTRMQRLQLDSLQMPGGHEFTIWWDRFHGDHPEYFALQPDGTRSAFPSPHRTKLCQSNPAVWDQWLADVVEQVEANPTKTVFHVAPNDSATSGICVCEDCRAWDHPDGEPWRYRWEGTSQQYVAMSDRYVTFSNHLARKLKERFPERDLHVSQFAYHSSTPPPVEATLEDNVIVGYVGYFPLTDEESRQEQKARFAGWAEAAPQLIYRPNQWVFAGVMGLPQVSMQKTIEDMRFLGEHNCVGMFVDTVKEHWATMGPHYYLMAQLAWNPERDGHAVLEEYYQRGFGNAAPHVKAYWNMMQQELGDLPYRMSVDEVQQNYLSDAFLDEAEQHLRDAAEAVEDDAPRYRQRVAFVQAGLDFTRLMLEITALMRRATQDNDTEALEQVKANWREIERIVEAHPVAVNLWGLRLQANRRGRNLLPE